MVLIILQFLQATLNLNNPKSTTPNFDYVTSQISDTIIEKLLTT